MGRGWGGSTRIAPEASEVEGEGEVPHRLLLKLVEWGEGAVPHGLLLKLVKWKERGRFHTDCS